MSSEFLQSSSPSRGDGDSHKNDHLSMNIMMPTQTPLHNKISTSSFPLTKSSSKTQQQLGQQQGQLPPQGQFFNVTASASKYLNQPLNLLGWTPLISKTYTNEQILSFNSTPNKLLLQTSNSTNNNNSMNNVSGVNDLDFQGFGLTPFLNHNINVLGSASSMNQFNSLTPYHEKIFHNSNDFYIDSPIRFGNTSTNEIQAITPSKFSLNSVANKKILQDPLKSATKRSIALLDTPPRQPHKLSISSKAEKDDKENETDDENIIPGKNRGVVNDEDNDEDDYDDDDNDAFDKKALLQTPSKVLKDITNKPPTTQFQTPAKQKLLAPSSPSTIILSSPTKGSSVKPKKSFLSRKENDSTMDMMINGPPSPTPAKNLPITPVMGVFNEKKSSTTTKGETSKKPLTQPTQKSTLSQNSSQSKSTTTTTNNNNKSKPKPKSKPKTKQASSSSSNNTSVNVDDSKRRAANKAKMQAGMNKFQIVLTDVHTLVNSKKKKPKDELKNTMDKKSISKQPSNNQLHPPLQVPPQSSSSSSVASLSQQIPPVQLNAQLSNMTDHNITMNSTKEHSSIISGGNNTMNTSHLNMTTDHSSFELGGNFASTPNSKFLLDKIFEKTSPQTNYFIHQQQQQQQQQMVQMTQQQHQHQQMIHALQQAQSQSLQDGSMPPPIIISSSNKQQPIQYLPPQQQQQMPMMTMTMSTPQHQGIINYNPQLYSSTGDNNTSPDALYTFATNTSTTPQGISIYHNTNSTFNNQQRHHPFDDSIE